MLLIATKKHDKGLYTSLLQYHH